MAWDNVHACPLKNDWEMMAWHCLAATEFGIYCCCSWHTAPVRWHFHYICHNLWSFVFLFVDFVTHAKPHWQKCYCQYSKTTHLQEIPFEISTLWSRPTMSVLYIGQILSVLFLLVILFTAILWKINAASALVIILCISLSSVSMQSWLFIAVHSLWITLLSPPLI